MNKFSFDIGGLPADQVGKATLPWLLGGAGVGAAGGAASYAMSAPDAKKHSSLLKSMSLGAALGGAGGAGLKALGGIYNPTSLGTSDITQAVDSKPAASHGFLSRLGALWGGNPTAAFGVGAGAGLLATGKPLINGATNVASGVKDKMKESTAINDLKTQGVNGYKASLLKSLYAQANDHKKLFPDIEKPTDQFAQSADFMGPIARPPEASSYQDILKRINDVHTNPQGMYDEELSRLTKNTESHSSPLSNIGKGLGGIARHVTWPVGLGVLANQSSHLVRDLMIRERAKELEQNALQQAQQPGGQQ